MDKIRITSWESLGVTETKHDFNYQYGLLWSWECHIKQKIYST